MARLSFAVLLALVCLAPGLASADSPLRLRSSLIRSFEDYDEAAQQRRLEQRQRINDLVLLRRQLEHSRTPTPVHRPPQRPSDSALLGKVAPSSSRGYSSVAAR